MLLSSRGLLLLSYVAFVSLGLPDTVLGVAWPSVRDGFALAQGDLGIVLASGVAGYVVSGAFAGRIVARLGVGGVLAASGLLVTAGLVGYAAAPAWPAFVAMAVIAGLGSGAIDAAINSFAAHHFPVRHVNWLHGFWSVGATAGPLVMTAALARAGTHRAGYAALAAILGTMTLAFALTRRAWDASLDSARADGSRHARDERQSLPVDAGTTHLPRRGARDVLRRGRAWLQIGLFFVYTGLESAVGAWCFTILRETRGLSIEAAGTWTAAYWGSHLAGRFVLGGVVDRVGPDRLLRLASAGALAGIALFALDGGLPGRLGLVVLGASLAPIFPTLMARTPARLGPADATHAVGFQVSAATLGTAVLPGTAGLLANALGAGAIAPALVVAAVALVALHESLLAATRIVPAAAPRGAR